jgi:hypothetical protein
MLKMSTFKLDKTDEKALKMWRNSFVLRDVRVIVGKLCSGKVEGTQRTFWLIYQEVETRGVFATSQDEIKMCI